MSLLSLDILLDILLSLLLRDIFMSIVLYTHFWYNIYLLFNWQLCTNKLFDISRTHVLLFTVQCNPVNYFFNECLVSHPNKLAILIVVFTLNFHFYSTTIKDNKKQSLLLHLFCFNNIKNVGAMVLINWLLKVQCIWKLQLSS